MASENARASELTIYTAGAVNPYKLTILLEELGVPYTPHVVSLIELENKSEWYTKINPNGRLPALSRKRADGKEITVWESAACLQYISDQFDAEYKFSFPPGTQEYYQMISWLCWQISGLAPSMGQATHFLRYSYEPVPYGVKRYVAESNRLFRVLETHLTKSNPDGTKLTYLVGNKFTIADIACYPWLASAWWCGIDVDNYPAVKAWRERIAQREGVKRGMEVPEKPFFADALTKDPALAETRKTIQTAVTAMVKGDAEANFIEPGKGYGDY